MPTLSEEVFLSIISAQGISKRYYLHHVAQQPTSMSTAVAKHIRNVANGLTRTLSAKTSKNELEEFWALNDVSFDIKPGERVGIIGKNGAGKSTLLKVLSRITEPTTGRISIKGRVASLLEVGTGFNPELTGRENVFLNGAILGMSRSEITRKFDEIVAFAEVEKFLDTPVKHYSSGMYMRLAFAVAAHLEPEILIVDEVLAVGDAQFQKKCLGKMKDVGQSGRTILFVSHNMQAIRQLCDRGILLRSGRVVVDGSVETCIDEYMSGSFVGNGKKSCAELIAEIPEDPVFKLEDIVLSQNEKVVGSTVESGCDLSVSIKFRVFEKTAGLRVYFDLLDDQDTLLFRSFNDEDNDGIPIVMPGRYLAACKIPANLLAPTNYRLKVYATIYNVRSFIPDGIPFEFDVLHTGLTNRAYVAEPIRGKLAPCIRWTTDQIAE